MRFDFTDDQKLFQSAVRAVLAKECAPAVVRAAWSKGARPRHLWKKLAELGVLGLTAPEKHGGLGLDELSLVLLLEECGRAAVPDPVLETTAVAAPLLRDSASAAMKERWLPAIASGDAMVSVMLERAPYALDADACDLLLVERRGQIFALERGVLTLVRQPSVDGARRLFSVTWRAGAEQPLLAPGAARAAFDRGALGASAELLGLAQQMIDLTVMYVKVRTQFGSPIGSFQAVKHHLANALVKLELARPVVYRAAYSVARGDEARSVHVSMAKAFASDAANLAARVALQCHGAIGYSFEHDLHLWMKRAWALAADWGDSAWHRGRVGDALFNGGSNG